MPETGEREVNVRVLDILQTTRAAWLTGVLAENTRTVRGANGKICDILITEPYASPVVVEAEFMPARTVEVDATSRLGLELDPDISSSPITTAIAVRYPARLKELHGDSLKSDLARLHDMDMAVFTSRGRWPASGWLTGSVKDLSILIQFALLPREQIDCAADIFQHGIDRITAKFNQVAESHAARLNIMAAEWGQADSVQTRRMTAAMLIIACVNNGRLAGASEQLADLRSLRDLSNARMLTVENVLAEWDKLEGVGFKTELFRKCYRTLQALPDMGSTEILCDLKDTATELLQNKLLHAQDLSGAVFQTLIADRKYLAAFYTYPAVASLMAGLVIRDGRCSTGESWRDANAITRLKIADFSCGTGTLLSAAYHRVRQLYELEGGDAADLHVDTMARVLYGFDVVPPAVVLTMQMLMGCYPTVPCRTNVGYLAYGAEQTEDERWAVNLGSLDLLKYRGRELMPMNHSSVTMMHSAGGEAERVEMPDFSCHFVIMNPPFTRMSMSNNNGESGVTNPMFKAFDKGEDERQAMQEALFKLTKGTCASGTAGLGSLFLALGDRKLAVNGGLAIVLPISILHGHSWAACRKLLVENYSDIIVVTVASTHGDVAFSSDSGPAECLIVATKRRGSRQAKFVTLNRRPDSEVVGFTISQLIHAADVSGTLYLGNDAAGEVMVVDLPAGGEAWRFAQSSDSDLVREAEALAAGRIKLCRMSDSEAVSIVALGGIAKTGANDRSICSMHRNGYVIGPFEMHILRSASPKYPALNENNASRERYLEFGADSECTIRTGRTSQEQASIDSRVQERWHEASHCHFNRAMNFNSQSTSFQFTPYPCLGGIAWISVLMANLDYEKAMTVWGNTSLGILLRWWYSNKQQPGRGMVGVTAFKSMPVFNVTALAPDRLAAAVRIFESMKSKELWSINKMHIDPSREELDRRFIVEVLGLDEKLAARNGPLDLLRQRLAQEPTVRGTKKLIPVSLRDVKQIQRRRMSNI